MGSALSLHWGTASARIPHARYLVVVVGDVFLFCFALFVCLMANTMLKLFQNLIIGMCLNVMFRDTIPPTPLPTYTLWRHRNSIIES